MDTEASNAPTPPRRRPPALFFVVVAALVVVGVVAPMTVNWVISHQESTIPPDTSGNRPDSAPRGELRADSAKGTP